MKMKTKFLSILLISLSILVNTFCLAASGDNITELEPGSEDFINNYEDYENLFGEIESGYSQEDLKNMYVEYQKSMKDYYNQYNRDETVKAKVIEAYDVEEIYEFNEYYYSVSKYEFQPITVRILEKEHEGKEFEIDYLLTGDSLNNIKYSELKVGDIIYVGFFTDEETGEVYADITNAGSNVERKGIIIFIGIISAALVIIYGGKKGIIASLISLLMLIFCLVIIPNMGFAGSGFVIGGILLVAALIITISIMNLGLKVDTLKAIGISSCLVLFSTILVFMFNYLTRTCGITFETAAISENVLLGNMKFESLYFIVTLLISTVFVSSVVAKSFKKMSKIENKDFNNCVNSCKNILSSNVLKVTMTLLAMYIPNHLLLLTNKYTFSEVWNAEILISELIRLFAIIITIAIAVPTVAVLNQKEEK